MYHSFHFLPVCLSVISVTLIPCTLTTVFNASNIFLMCFGILSAFHTALSAVGSRYPSWFIHITPILHLSAPRAIRQILLHLIAAVSALVGCSTKHTQYSLRFLRCSAFIAHLPAPFMNASTMAFFQLLSYCPQQYVFTVTSLNSSLFGHTQIPLLSWYLHVLQFLSFPIFFILPVWFWQRHPGIDEQVICQTGIFVEAIPQIPCTT